MNLPALEQFRLETRDNGLAHLVFDCPGRTMNVFSEAAIAEINAVAAWLAGAEVTGLLIRSGKANAFCAGADLTELGVAYDMIMERPPHERFETAFDHFFRLSRGLRALETAGKPVAVAIAGLALGGGCELALAGHYRVLVDDPKIGLGLPESLVGLLPGAGGTQRLPRLIGIDAALPVLLEGKRLSGSEALDAGLVDSLCAPGAEIAAAEQWLLATPHACQPWDRDDYESADAALVSDRIAPVREQVLAATLGHHPAELAILDCVEFGMPQMFDGAIRSEMAIFARLIQRAEARNMIQTLFLAKTEHDRMKRKQALPPFVAEAVAAANQAIARESAEHGDALAAAGFRGMADRTEPVRSRVRDGYWIDGEGPLQAEARAALDRIGGALGGIARGHGPDELRIADYAIVAEAGYPAYLGGPFAWMGQAG